MVSEFYVKSFNLGHQKLLLAKASLLWLCDPAHHLVEGYPSRHLGG